MVAVVGEAAEEEEGGQQHNDKRKSDHKYITAQFTQKHSSLSTAAHAQGNDRLKVDPTLTHATRQMWFACNCKEEVDIEKGYKECSGEAGVGE